MSKKILVIDDEKKIASIVSFNLRKEGYRTIEAYDGEQGLNLSIEEKPDLILLDIMMPKLNGFEVCKKIREFSQVPIIMLTAKAEETDKVVGLNCGADDYVVKPFGLQELLARVKANLRRNDLASSTHNDIAVYGEISFNYDTFLVKKRDDIVDLTKREYELLKFLATHHTKVFSREILLEKVWGYLYYGDARTVDVTVRRLRSKLEDNSEKPKYVLTKRGIGYYFNINNDKDEYKTDFYED